MKTYKLLSIILLLNILCTKAMGQLITDRPDQTESSSTVPMGALQLESGILLGYSGNTDPSSRELLLPTSLFRYGITDWFELRVLSQIEMIKMGTQSLEGISDMEIGTKIQLLKQENINTEIAFLTHLIIPTGSKELTSDKIGTSNKISISHGLSDVMGIGYNLGYNFFGEGNGDLTYSLALGISINDKVGAYIEPYGEILNLEELNANFDAGFTFLAKENLQFDFSFGTGINHKMNYVSIGLSWLMKKNNSK